MRLKNLGPRGEYHARPLHPPDISALQSLYERGADYFEVATGTSPRSDEAKRAFVAGPPSKSVDDKRIIGVFDSRDHLVGVVDSLVDFPAEGDWTIGMLLIDPHHRGLGLGRAVLHAYESWTVRGGARRLHTAVVSHHQPGIRFLEASGYVRQRAVDNYDAGARRASVVFFAKAIGC